MACVSVIRAGAVAGGHGSGPSTSGVELGKGCVRCVYDDLFIRGAESCHGRRALFLRKDNWCSCFDDVVLVHDVAQSCHVKRALHRWARSVHARRPWNRLLLLDRAGPFASGNPEPAPALLFIVLVHAESEAGQADPRVRFSLRDGAIVNGIEAFGAHRPEAGTCAHADRGQPLHVAEIARGSSTATGTERVQLRVLDVVVPDQGRRS